LPGPRAAKAEPAANAGSEIGGERPDLPAFSPAQRILLAFAALSLVGALWNYTGTTVDKRWLGAPLGLALLATLGAIGAAMTVTSRRVWARWEFALAGIGILTLCVNAFAQPLFNGLTHTDEETFLQAAASALLHGHNPYTANFQAAEIQYHVPPFFATKLDAGGYTHSLNYPAGAVYALLPFQPFHTGGHALVAAGVTGFALAALLMALILPTGWRALAPLLMAGSVVSGTAFFGASSPLTAAPLVLAAWKWQDTGRGGKLGRWGWVRALALGVAASIQQVAWFAVPFAVLGVYFICRTEQGAAVARAVTVRFSAVVAGVFIVLNLPFAIWGPTAWFKGIMAPMFQHTLPEGQGLVNLAQALNLHTGGSPIWFTVAGLVWLLALLAAYAIWFEKLRYACFALPALALFAPSRSFMIYFVAFAPAWLMSAAGEDWRRVAAPFKLTPHTRRLVAWGLTAACAAVSVVALAVPQPLRITVLDAETSGVANTTISVTVRVENRTGHPVSPVYLTLDDSGMSSHDWLVANGPQRISAHSSATLVLVTPDVDSAPFSRKPFKLEALTDGPPSYSVSQPFQAEQLATRIIDDGAVLRPGVPTTVRVQLINAYDSTSLSRPGVPIYLEALFFTPSDHPIPYVYDAKSGSPVANITVMTDANGAASFTLVSHEPPQTVIYLRAHLAHGSAYNGYSSLAVVSGLG
jgi:uncharacterized membrane protein